MKKIKKLMVMLLCMYVAITSSQVRYLTPGGKFDTLCDASGRRFLLNDLSLDAGQPFLQVGETRTKGQGLTSAIGYTCTAGCFELYFQNGMTVNGTSNPVTIAAIQTVICEAFKNVSDFLNTPLSSSSAPHVRIYVSSMNTFFAAAISPLYAYPTTPVNPNQGYIDNLAEAMLLSGQDPYSTLPISFLNPGPNAFFHANLVLASNSLGYSWDVTLMTGPASTEIDLYSVMLHEIGHLLGIASNISSSGASKLINTNTYTRYDSRLQDASGNRLLGPATSACAANITFTGSTAAIGNAVSSCSPDITNCANAVKYVDLANSFNIKVYTPFCFDASSLEHLEDMCSAPYNRTSCTPNPVSPGYNNLYFVMSNASLPGGCGFKRYYADEERALLCDLGYSTAGLIYTFNGILQSNTSNMYSYSGSCPGNPVVGVNDGIQNGIYTFMTTGNSIMIPGAQILQNDLGTGIDLSCVEMVYTDAFNLFAASYSGGMLTVSGNAGSGVAIVKYQPKDASGVYGNATYIFVYFAAPNCNPASYCDIVQNGGFESGSNQCGGNIGSNPPDATINCWDEYPSGSTDSYRYSSFCPAGSGMFNLGANTLGSPIPVSTMLPGNDAVVALTYTDGTGITSALKNHLAMPLVAGQNYLLEFWAINYQGPGPGNTNLSNPLVVNFSFNNVISFVPPGTFPFGLNSLAQFTIQVSNTWKKYSATISVPISAGNQNAMVVGIEPNATSVNGIWSPGMTGFLFLDDISILPQGFPNLATTNPTLCGNFVINDLNIFTSSSFATFTGPYVTPYNNTYAFNINGNVPPGVYPIQATFTMGACTYTQTDVLTISTNTDYASLTNTIICSNTSTFDINSILYTTPAVTGGTYYLNGSPSGNIITLTPGSTAIVGFAPAGTGLCTYMTSTAAVQFYTVLPMPLIIVNGNWGPTQYTTCGVQTLTLDFYSSAIYNGYYWSPVGTQVSTTNYYTATTSTVISLSVYSYSQCPTTATVAIQVFTNCCNGTTLTPFQPSTMTSTVITGTIYVDHNITVNGGWSYWVAADVVFFNNAQVTISNGSGLQIASSHLYSCDNYMWKGIVVQNGGQVMSSGNSMIEDAQVALDVSNHTSTGIFVLDLHNTTFNRNHTSIKIVNYPAVVNYANMFVIDNCIFTSRAIPTSVGTWPGSGTTSGGLRAAITSTTGLVSPYLSNYSISNLKPPYSSQPSDMAIYAYNVGSGATNYEGLQVGSSANATDFNLFDAHGGFISAVNTNLYSYNNVFQNTQQYLVPYGSGYITAGGTAVLIGVNNGMNSKTDMMATNFNLGNRFWNCHKGLDMYASYLLKIEKAIFRSTQSTGNTSFSQGNLGIGITGNQLFHYIRRNEFTNVNTGINVSILSTGYVDSTGSHTGINGKKLSIMQNTFSANFGAPVGTNYLNNAVNISCAGGNLFAAPPAGASNYAINVDSNNISQAFRGVYINGINGFQTNVRRNVVALINDATFSTAQYGVSLTNNIGLSTRPGQFNVSHNTLSGSALNNIQTMGFFDSNAGTISPSIACNAVSNSNAGFRFWGNNSGTRWEANTMTDHQYGMTLEYTGVIGTQGSAGQACGDMWLGTLWGGTNYGTWVDNTSSAATSKLYELNTQQSPNPGGGSSQLYVSPNKIVNVGGAYADCVGGAGARHAGGSVESTLVIPDNTAGKITFYRYLAANPEMQAYSSDVTSFYTQNKAGDIGILAEAEQLIGSGNFYLANTVLNRISTVNEPAISLYKQVLQLNILYLQNVGTNNFHMEGSPALLKIANMCAGTNGPAVYKARALYLAIEPSYVFHDDCPVREGRIALLNPVVDEAGDIELYPNPAFDKVMVSGLHHDNTGKIEIYDVSGRLLINKSLDGNPSVSLDLPLPAGVYLVKVSERGREIITRRLIKN